MSYNMKSAVETKIELYIQTLKKGSNLTAKTNIKISVKKKRYDFWNCDEYEYKTK